MSSQGTLTKPKRSRQSATDTLSADPTELARQVLELPFTDSLIRRKASQLTRHRGFSDTDDEDITQELRISVYLACLKYRRSEGAIESFITTVVRNRVAELARNRAAKRRSPECEAGSLNQIIDTGDGPVQWVDMFDVEKHGRPRAGQRRGDSEQVELLHDIEAVLEKLSNETREVARLLMHYSSAEIEQQLGMRRGKIRSHISLIREHFESCGLHDYLGI